MDASRSPPEAGTIVLAAPGSVSAGEVRWLCERVRFLLEGSDAKRVVCDVVAIEEPDAGIVELLARMQLAAKQHGGTVELRDADQRLRDLLELAGLTEVVRCV